MTDQGSDRIEQMVDHLFRHESGKMIAVLCKLLGIGNLETAQDIVQDTLLQAMKTWRFAGMPEHPPAWLYKVARNKAIDFLRREKRFRQLAPDYGYLLESEYSLASTLQTFFLHDEIQDSQLRMMFACCHPSIPPDSQIAMTLKVLCGLSPTEIARAFLSNEDTINKRIYRAKEKIVSCKIELEFPGMKERGERIDSVLQSLYLLFSEGYHSAHPDQLIRKELCAEAMRLGSFLIQHKETSLPRVHALMALWCFQSSRLDARLDADGQIILLKNQDRSKWNRALITRGFEYLETAAEPFEVSSYHFEASIAALHAASPAFEHTDWKSIYHLYELLYQIQPNPIIAMNKAIASAYAIDRLRGLDELQQIKGLESHHLYYASIGEMYFDLHRKEEARVNFQRALELTNSQIERSLFQEKIRLCES